MKLKNLLKRIWNSLLKSERFISEYLYLSRSPLFDKEFYLKSNLDVAQVRLNPLTHYLVYGFKEGRNPHPLFDVKFYTSENPHIVGYKMNPLIHYIKIGSKEGARPHPLFDTNFYLLQNNDLAGTDTNALIHYIKHWSNFKVQPHPLFDSEYYVMHNLDVKNLNVMPLRHYIMNWESSGVTIHQLFENVEKVGVDTTVKKELYEKVFGKNSINGLYDIEGLIQSIYKNLERGNFRVADSLFPRERVIKRLDIMYTCIKSMKEWIKENGKLVYEQNQPSNKVYFSAANREFILTPPQEYVGVLNKVQVVGGTKLVLDADMNLLYDELADFDHSSKGEYDVKLMHHVKVTDYNKAELFNIKRRHNMIINEGILISSDHDNNYFHFLVECLSKVMMIKEHSQFNGVPILVGKDLHRNLIKALELVTNGVYPVIQLENGFIYEVKKLVYASDLSRVMDKYEAAYRMGHDVVLSPKWIGKVKEALALENGDFGPVIKRKIYITRRTGNYRCLLNEEDLEFEMLKRGFEIVDLAECSFVYQQRLFSQAEVVVGPTGAAVTNMILSPKGAKFIIITSDHPGITVDLWEQLANACEVNVKFCTGNRAFKREDFHDDYTIPLEKLLNMIDMDD